jgi:fucose permease
MDRSLAKFVFFTTCAVFFFFGIYNAGLGSVLLELSDRTGSTLSAVGMIFTAIYAGSLLTQFSSGWLTTLFGRVKVMTVSVFLMSLGIFGLISSTSLPILVISCFILGLGQGGVDIISNNLVTEAYPKTSVEVLNILHLAFGVGATVGPKLISVAIRNTGGGLLVEGLVAIMLFFSGFFYLFIHKNKSINNGKSRSEFAQQEISGNEIPFYRDILIWLLGFMLLLIVGTQFSAGSWAVVFMTKTLDMRTDQASLVASLYWMFISLGRIIAVFMARYVSQKDMLYIHLGGSLVGAVLYTLFVGQRVPSIISLLMISLFFGGLYPLLLAFIPKYFGNNIDKASSIIVSLGTVGGLILPWVTGSILNGISPTMFTWALVLCISLIGLLSISFLRKIRSYGTRRQ